MELALPDTLILCFDLRSTVGAVNQFNGEHLSEESTLSLVADSWVHTETATVVFKFILALIRQWTKDGEVGDGPTFTIRHFRPYEDEDTVIIRISVCWDTMYSICSPQIYLRAAAGLTEYRVDYLRLIEFARNLLVPMGISANIVKRVFFRPLMLNTETEDSFNHVLYRKAL